MKIFFKFSFNVLVALLPRLISATVVTVSTATLSAPVTTSTAKLTNGSTATATRSRAEVSGANVMRIAVPVARAAVAIQRWNTGQHSDMTSYIFSAPVAMTSAATTTNSPVLTAATLQEKSS